MPNQDPFNPNASLMPIAEQPAPDHQSSTVRDHPTGMPATGDDEHLPSKPAFPRAPHAVPSPGPGVNHQSEIRQPVAAPSPPDLGIINSQHVAQEGQSISAPIQHQQFTALNKTRSVNDRPINDP